eukprot:335886-Pyramimonas_sp.AAC.1
MASKVLTVNSTVPVSSPSGWASRGACYCYCYCYCYYTPGSNRAPGGAEWRCLIGWTASAPAPASETAARCP